MPMRITGLGTGLDVDSIVKQTMNAYRMKIDQQTQKKDITEIKQQLYKDIMNESKEFYNKYFDILKSDSLTLSSNWKNVEFKSDNPSVRVSGNSEAKAENYKISGTTATAASLTIIGEIGEGKDFVVNGKSFTLKGTSSKDISNFNAELKAEGINVSVRYTAFTGKKEAGVTKENEPGIIFESTKLGDGNQFVVGGTVSDMGSDIVGSKTQGLDATFTTVKLGDDLSGLTGKISINGSEIDLSGLTDDSDKKGLINSKLKADGVKAELTISDGKYELVSTVAGKDGTLEMNSIIPIEGNKTQGLDATFTTIKLGSNLQKLKDRISINGSYIDLSGLTDDSEKRTLINSKLAADGIKVTLSDGADGSYKLVSTVAGKNGDLEIKSIVANDTSKEVATDGKKAEITIEDSKGGVYKHKDASNTFTVDGVTFEFLGKIEENIKITGETNVEGLKDGIVKLFNDYNNLIEKINTLTTEKKSKGYSPLTKEQRSELTEKEAELWDEKVKKGQLYKDSDLTRIANNLKSAMRTMVDGTGLTLEKIGITPAKDYAGTKNGTFTIDEDKLSKALETDLDNIKNMFITLKPTTGTDSEKYTKTGIFGRMKDILYNETMISTSKLAKKVGLLGTSTATDNTLSNSIKTYERKIEDMEVALSRKEQLLYNKYSKLESLMNSYNSQQSYLAQSLGTGQ